MRNIWLVLAVALIFISAATAMYTGGKFEVTEVQELKKIIGDLPTLNDMNILREFIEEFQISYSEVESWDWGVFNWLKNILTPLFMVLTFLQSVIKVLMNTFKLIMRFVYFIYYIFTTVFTITPAN